MESVGSVVRKMSSFIVMDILDRAAEMEKNGIDVIHMEVGEPDFQPSECICKAVDHALLKEETHYTHSLGTLRLREAIADDYKKNYGVEVSPDRIVVTSGSSPAILMVLQVLCGRQSNVIVTNPGYSCYKNIILAAGAQPNFVSVEPADGFQYPIEAVKKAIDQNTVAIIVNSPMNPTGTLVSDETYRKLSELGIPIVSDEIYHGLIYKGNSKTVLQYTENAFVINGFSKKYAMTGFRLGYIIAPSEYMRDLQVLQQNLFICAPSISQEAAISALTDAHAQVDVEKRRLIYDERRVFMIDRLREMGFKIEFEPQGAFYIFADARRFTNDSYKFAFDVLESAHVGITPGVDFGTNGEGFIRFSYANSLEKLEEGLKRLQAFLNA